MPVSINGQTGIITGVSVGGLPDSIVDTDMLAANAVSAAKLASGVGGKILQVVSVTKTEQFSSSSTSYTDITGCTLNITPSATSSKIYVTLFGGQWGSRSGPWFRRRCGACAAVSSDGWECAAGCCSSARACKVQRAGCAVRCV